MVEGMYTARLAVLLGADGPRIHRLDEPVSMRSSNSLPPILIGTVHCTIGDSATHVGSNWVESASTSPVLRRLSLVLRSGIRE